MPHELLDPRRKRLGIAGGSALFADLPEGDQRAAQEIDVGFLFEHLEQGGHNTLAQRDQRRAK
ncbi:MAG: hypothetical protein AAF368_09940, partial [Planctomycetota bacterium]